MSEPLRLDDVRWAKLTHAYGPARDVPAMIRALADAKPDAWDDIWSALCHQGSVYTASYAAVPHIFALGATQPAKAQRAFWSFAGAVACSPDAAPIPDDLRDAFEAAIADAEPRAVACMVPGIAERDAIWLAVAITGLRRNKAIAHAVESLADEEHTAHCSSCRAVLSVTLTELPFEVSDSDGRTNHLTSRSPRPELVAIADLVRAADLPDLADRMLALDGTVTCPACGHRFDLLPHDAG